MENRYTTADATKFLRQNPCLQDNYLSEFYSLELLHSAEGMLVYVVGAKGSGKTATAFFIAENEHIFQPNRKIYYIGREFNKDVLPVWKNKYANTNTNITKTTKRY